MTTRAKFLLVQFCTGSRVLLAGGVVAVLATVSAGAAGAWAAVGLLAIIELTDFLDGTLARRLGATSRFGELFDPYCDSVARLIVFFALASADLVPLWLPAVMAIRDVSVAYVRILCMHTGRKVAARFSGKLKAVVQGAGAIALVMTAAIPALADVGGGFIRHVAVGAIAAITAWSAVDYLLGALRPHRV
jgi:CDP-diacylglycerol--glycerol-3-phosphate 3-phosphatidyltransferase